MTDCLNRNLFKIDPRTLILLNICFCMMMLVVSSSVANHVCFVIAFVLMLMVGLYKKTLFFAVTYSIIAILNYFFLIYPVGRIQMFVSLLFYMFCKFIPIVMLASILVNSIKTSEMITSLEKMKVPKGILIAIIVAVRFVPTIKYEMAFIKDSMYLRGLDISFKNAIGHPLRTLEYALIPLLFRSLKIADELTATALTRGVEYEAKRSAYFDVNFRKLDGIIIVFTFIASFFVYLVDHAVRVT